MLIKLYLNIFKWTNVEMKALIVGYQKGHEVLSSLLPNTGYPIVATQFYLENGHVRCDCFVSVLCLFWILAKSILYKNPECLSVFRLSRTSGGLLSASTFVASF